MSRRRVLERLEDLERRVKQLECSHKHKELIHHWGGADEEWWIVKCRDCGKVLGCIHSSEQAKWMQLEIERERHEEEIEKIEHFISPADRHGCDWAGESRHNKESR